MCNKNIIMELVRTKPIVRAAYTMIENTGGTYEEMLEILVIHLIESQEEMESKILRGVLNA